MSPVTEEREGVHYKVKQQEGDSGVLPSWNIFVAFFISFWVRLRLLVALELLGDPCLYYGLQHFIRRRRKADPLLGVFSANSKMSSTRQTKASNSYRLVPRTTGANTVQKNC